MLMKSTITLLRIPFSFFLMPVFFFALSQVPEINSAKALLVFVILHLIMYPASNGYNSYMDQDEGSIGMLENPPVATRDLYYLSLLLDACAVLFSFLINMPFALCIVANILASRAYSYRGIRLKRFAVTGFLTVVVFQGAITYYMVYKGAASAAHLPVPWMGMLISSFLFGGFYPLTQIYQHQQDLKDGVQTISYKLGYMGTFIFSGIMYAIAELLLFIYFSNKGQQDHFLLLQVCFVPVAGYFLFWWFRVYKDQVHASFRYCMRMNLVAAVCTNTGFILFNLMNHPVRHLF
jgi:1,4-dihydroxy-2-naphthoate octaprenyltransferase